jgi:hypothetical protein
MAEKSKAGWKKGLAPGVTPEEALGLDVRKYWATGVQVTNSEDFTVFVFREQGLFDLEDGEEPHLLMKNVVSVVVPKKTALSMIEILRSQLSDESGDEPA